MGGRVSVDYLSEETVPSPPDRLTSRDPAMAGSTCSSKEAAKRVCWSAFEAGIAGLRWRTCANMAGMSSQPAKERRNRNGR